MIVTVPCNLRRILYWADLSGLGRLSFHFQDVLTDEWWSPCALGRPRRLFTLLLMYIHAYTKVFPTLSGNKSLLVRAGMCVVTLPPSPPISNAWLFWYGSLVCRTYWRSGQPLYTVALGSPMHSLSL